ncbi:MAG: Imm50 family immunity protein [Pyrinomonadaceae bacterium]
MERLKNEKALIDIFGRWPSFHDAEILSIYLDRDGEGGPFLDAKIHVSEMTNEVDAKGYYVSKNDTLVILRFTHIVMGEIKWFNQQNVVADLNIEEVKPEENDGSCFSISIESSYGCEASFGCREIVITDVEPYAPAA